MSGEHVVAVLTEIRDQQRQQIANFERAIELQSEAHKLQQKSRPIFMFLIFAPWAVMAILGVLSLANLAVWFE